MVKVQEEQGAWILDAKCSFCLSIISFAVIFSQGIFAFDFSPIKCMLKTKKHNQGTKENKQYQIGNSYLNRIDTHA